MMGQTKRKNKGRKEGGKEGRTKKSNQQQNLYDCVLTADITYTENKNTRVHHVK